MQGREPAAGPPPCEWKAALNDRLSSIGCCVTFELDSRPRETIAVINLRKGACAESIQHTLRELLSGMHDTCVTRLAVGVGNAYRWQGRDITQSLSEAQTAVEYSFYYGPGEVIPFAAIPVKEDHRPYTSRSEALSAAVRLADFATAEATLREVLQEDTHGGYPHPAELKEAVLQLLANAAAIFSPLIPARDYEGFIEEMKCRISRCPTYPELRQAAADTMHTMCDKMADLHLHKHDAIMTDCLNYIDQHFNEEELSLVELAHRFHFNISYFSNFIKKKTGAGFSRHLLNVRMSHAKELLRSTDLKVYEIAEKVGYKDVKYFNRVFKKQLGVSPYTFRQLAFQCGEGMPVWKSE
jgi:two-component system response regulator YesN